MQHDMYRRSPVAPEGLVRRHPTADRCEEGVVSPEAFFRDLLAKAGITIDGDQPWDILVRDPRVYARMLRDGTLGFGESFMEGWLDCERIDLMAERVYRADLTHHIAVRTAA